MTKRMRLAPVKGIFVKAGAPEGIHLTGADGSLKKNQEYCKKVGAFASITNVVTSGFSTSPEFMTS